MKAQVLLGWLLFFPKIDAWLFGFAVRHGPHPNPPHKGEGTVLLLK